MKKNSRRNDSSGGVSAPDRRPKLLFVGEGPADIGREDDPGGAAAGLLHAYLSGHGDPIDLELMPYKIGTTRQWKELPSLPRPTKKISFEEAMLLDAEGRRVRAALVLAMTMELDGVFVIKDCEQEGRFDLQTKLRHAKTEFERDDAKATRPRLIVATPSRALEAWLLADPDAVESVFGVEGVYQFSKSPEERPHSDTLKTHINAHAKRCHIKPANARIRLAFRASPKTLARRCPKCYPPFQKDVEEELRPLLDVP